jgi:hypothetical protein
MPEVEWSHQANARLEAIDPAVADQLRNNAPKLLHEIPPMPEFPRDEGSEGEVMWHRAVAHEEQCLEPEQDDGPQNYLYFYLPWVGAPQLGEWDPEFEIRAIYHNTDYAQRMIDATVADWWEKMNGNNRLAN